MESNPGKTPEKPECPYTADDVFFYSEDLAESIDNPVMKRHLAECQKCRNILDGFTRVSNAAKKLRTETNQNEPRGTDKKAIPEFIGDFKILSEIAEGGMGKVFKAYDSSLDRFLAVKVMKDELSHNAKFCDRFTSEAKILAKLNHPNIVLVHTVGRYAGQIYIAMEFIEGESLLERIRHRRLDLSDALQTFSQILAGMKAAHEQQIVHRDIKPANIMITISGLVKILDFGLAKEALMAPTGQSMESGLLLGTLAYMAPEVAMGMKATKQSDIYALGLVLYQMLTNRIPFIDSPATLAMIERIKTEPLIPPSQINPDIPRSLEEFILKMCAKRADERHTSIDSIITSLARLAECDQRIAEAMAHSPSPAPASRAPWMDNPDAHASKFYFCESCGKRVTAHELEAGKGRNKKRKGVYCAECAIGVMTVEFDAMPEPSNKTSAPAGPLVASASGTGAKRPPSARSRIVANDRTADRPISQGTKPGNPRRRKAAPAAATAGIAGGIVAVCVLVLFIVSQKPGAHTASSTSPTSTVHPPAIANLNKEITSLPPATAQVPSAPLLPVKPQPEPVIQVQPAFEKPIQKPVVDPIVAKPIAESPEPKPAIGAIPVQKPEPAIPAEVKKPAPAPATNLVMSPAGQKQFAAVLKELSPLLSHNRFGDAEKLLDERLRDSSLSEAWGLLKKEKSDLAEVRALRQRALDALKATKGASITLKIRGVPMSGVIKEEANRPDISLALRDGPEMTLRADQIDVEDVDSFATAETGTARGQDLWRRGLLFLDSGDSVKAESYFSKARDAGFADATSYLDRIASVKSDAKEASASEAWKKAEALFASKNWKSAKSAYESFQRDFTGLKTLAANTETLKLRLEEIETALGPPKALGLDLGGGIKLELVLIAPGEFMMGSDEGESVEKPVHKVKISKPFYIGKYPVTQTQYEKVMGKNPSEFKGENLPVETVKFTDAEAFCKKAAALLGRSLHLPTEAEWEYACRAGTTSRYYSGDHPPEVEPVAWHKGNSENKTHPVGQKKPNAWGLYDMHGNVWEWCQDWFDGEYYSKSAPVDPTGSMQGALRAVRGGAWRCDAWDCRSAARIGIAPDGALGYIGFRVAVSVPGE